MPALMRPNPVRANLQAGGNVYGTMAFEFFSTCIALERIALKEGVALTPGSHRTPCWRELDSNPRSPVTRHPDLDVRHRRRASALTALALRCKVRSTQIRRLNATP